MIQHFIEMKTYHPFVIRTPQYNNVAIVYDLLLLYLCH